MTNLDLYIMSGYILFVFFLSIFLSRRQNNSEESFFLANRKIPWWWLGVSIVATTFSADTPLAITGIIANNGISGNWFWWSWVFGYLGIAVFFAKKWRKTSLLTDVEFIELRYDSRSASFLRFIKAFYLSLILNGLVLGWVFRSMTKIIKPFIQWDQILPVSFYVTLRSYWPEYLIFDNFDSTISVVLILFIVTAYSSWGGIQGVIFTDLFQFIVSMAGAIVFAYFALEYVGGMTVLKDQLKNVYPNSHLDILSFYPTGKELFSVSIQSIIVYLSVQWWANSYSDGSGYIAQRANTARSENEAEKGVILFSFFNFILRTWPWVIVALVALILFPIDNPSQFFKEEGILVGTDRESAYPVLMKIILPVGVLGFVLVSLISAFMSTVDTHINWGASYLTNDLFKRFFFKDVSQKGLIRFSRISVVCMTVLGITVASQIHSIEKAWKFFMAMGAGLGMPQILRWIWWRANAYTEISGMITALLVSIFIHYYFPFIQTESIILYSASISTIISILITFLTPQTDPAVLQYFVNKIQPIGFWGKYSSKKNGRIVLKKIISWISGSLSILAGMFSIGYLVFQNYFMFIMFFFFFIICIALFLKYLKD